MTAVVSVAETQAELAAVEERMDALRIELSPLEARADQLRERLAASLFAQAEALLGQLSARRPLTRRELQFARAYAVSRESVQELADRHWVSVNTVKTHIRNSFKKLGVRSRAQLRHALVEAARDAGGAR